MAPQSDCSTRYACSVAFSIGRSDQSPNKVVYKDWSDSGHDPNRTEMTVAEFLAGKMHYEIKQEMGHRILKEALATVERLTSGGPGVAEPPD